MMLKDNIITNLRFFFTQKEKQIEWHGANRLFSN